MNQLSKLIYLLGLRTICRPAPGANSSLELALNCRVNAQLCLATPSYTEADGDRDAQLHLHREGSTPSLCGGGPVSRDYSGPELRGRFTTGRRREGRCDSAAPPRVGFPKPLFGSGWSKQDGTLGVCTVNPNPWFQQTVLGYRGGLVDNQRV